MAENDMKKIKRVQLIFLGAFILCQTVSSQSKKKESIETRKFENEVTAYYQKEGMRLGNTSCFLGYIEEVDFLTKKIFAFLDFTNEIPIKQSADVIRNFEDFLYNVGDSIYHTRVTEKKEKLDESDLKELKGYITKEYGELLNHIQAMDLLNKGDKNLKELPENFSISSIEGLLIDYYKSACLKISNIIKMIESILQKKTEEEIEKDSFLEEKDRLITNFGKHFSYLHFFSPENYENEWNEKSATLESTFKIIKELLSKGLKFKEEEVLEKNNPFIFINKNFEKVKIALMKLVFEDMSHKPTTDIAFNCLKNAFGESIATQVHTSAMKAYYKNSSQDSMTPSTAADRENKEDKNLPKKGSGDSILTSSTVADSEGQVKNKKLYESKKDSGDCLTISGKTEDSSPRRQVVIKYEAPQSNAPITNLYLSLNDNGNGTLVFPSNISFTLFSMHPLKNELLLS